MKKLIVAGLVALFGLGLWSCNQNEAVSPDADSPINAARLGSDTTGFFCRDSLTKINVATLPPTVTSYISTSYAGATVNYAAKDDAGNFLVVITQNSLRKALLFNADGTFNRELSLREGGKGHGHGQGGGNRDSLNRVAVANLPAAITSYITTNYAGATIRAAGKNTTGQFKVIVQPTTGRLVELSFAANGTFVQARTRR